MRGLVAKGLVRVRHEIGSVCMTAKRQAGLVGVSMGG